MSVPQQGGFQGGQDLDEGPAGVLFEVVVREEVAGKFALKETRDEFPKLFLV